MSEPVVLVARLRDDESGARFFFKVDCDLASESGNDSHIRLLCTDGSKIWQNTGVQQQGTKHKDWHTVLLACFKSDPDCKKIRITQDADSLKVVFVWQKAGASFGQKYPLQIPLLQTPGPKLGDFIEELHLNNEQLLERCARLQRNFEALHSELQHFDSLQQEVVGQRKQQEDQYVKFAAVLNEKKMRIRELEAKLPATCTAQQDADDDRSEDASGEYSQDSDMAEEHNQDHDMHPSSTAGVGMEPLRTDEASQQEPGGPTDDIMNAETQLISQPSMPGPEGEHSTSQRQAQESKPPSDSSVAGHDQLDGMSEPKSKRQALGGRRRKGK